MLERVEPVEKCRGSDWWCGQGAWKTVNPDNRHKLLYIVWSKVGAIPGRGHTDPEEHRRGGYRACVSVAF